MPVSREQWTPKCSRQFHPALASVEQAGELDAVLAAGTKMCEPGHLMHSFKDDDVTQTVNTPSPEGDGFSAKLRGNPHASRPKASSRPLELLQHVAGGVDVAVKHETADVAAVHPVRERLRPVRLRPESAASLGGAARGRAEDLKARPRTDEANTFGDRLCKILEDVVHA